MARSRAPSGQVARLCLPLETCQHERGWEVPPQAPAKQDGAGQPDTSQPRPRENQRLCTPPSDRDGHCSSSAGRPGWECWRARGGGNWPFSLEGHLASMPDAIGASRADAAQGISFQDELENRRGHTASPTLCLPRHGDAAWTLQGSDGQGVSTAGSTSHQRERGI